MPPPDPNRRAPAATPVEPTLPLDMPRAARPEPRPASAKRHRSATAEADADLFGGNTALRPGRPEASAPTRPGRRAGTRPDPGTATAAPAGDAATAPSATAPGPRKGGRRRAAASGPTRDGAAEAGTGAAETADTATDGPFPADPVQPATARARKDATGATGTVVRGSAGWAQENAEPPSVRGAAIGATGDADGASVQPSTARAVDRTATRPGGNEESPSVRHAGTGAAGVADAATPQRSATHSVDRTTARPDGDAEPLSAPGAPPGGAGLLLPDEVLLQKVDPRSFRPNERSDAWLYWLTDRDRAEEALRDGLPVEPDRPVLLADRRSMPSRLAALAEDPDFAPGAVAVLRLRRIAVEALLRPGPEPACYVLAGEAKLSA